jgi:hypothetical protein
MDQAVIEMLQLLQLRAELLAILRGPDADRRLQRWLMLHRSLAMKPSQEVSPSSSPDAHGIML